MTLLHQTCELERDYCELERDHCDGIFDYRVVLKPVNWNIGKIYIIVYCHFCLSTFKTKPNG